jgi:hypothetical protein
MKNGKVLLENCGSALLGSRPEYKEMAVIYGNRSSLFIS